MKKYKIISISFTCLFFTSFSSCEKYNDSDIRNQLKKLEDRVENLEKQIQNINSNITSINSIISLLQTNKYITKIENVDNGFKIILSDNSQFVLTNGRDGNDGKTPIINIRSYNGTYYWSSSIDNVITWLYDTNGNMIPATGLNGITPLLKVDSDGYWVVSYDSGRSYSLILDSSSSPIKAKAEENHSYFESLVIVNNDLILTLKDGTELSLPIGKISPYKAIDLGLTVKWSSTNYEANNSHQTGGLYLWGDVDNKGIIGFYDAPNLNSIAGTAYDIIRKNLGENWRMPNLSEQTELITKCKWTRTTLNGVDGMKVVGPNGNSIFIPPTGYALPKDGAIGSIQIVSPMGGYYWTGDSHTSGGSRFGYYFYFNSTSYYYNASINTMAAKKAIRPVKE